MTKNIIILVGMSSSGKDYIQEILVNGFNYERIVSTTSRSKRVKEKEGREYYFVTKEKFLDLIDSDSLIEYRTYNTLVDGIPDVWFYGMTKQEFNIDKNYVVILDVQGAKDFIKHIGEENTKVFYIDCPSSVRTERAKARGSFDEKEWSRRLISDAIDFAEDKMIDIKYKTINNNDRDIQDVINEIISN